MIIKLFLRFQEVYFAEGHTGYGTKSLTLIFCYSANESGKVI
jgi:hypothetical protein